MVSLRAYIGLGSNLGQPFQQIRDAIKALDEHQDVDVVNTSGFYLSKPMGPEDQPDYVNAVIEIKTTMTAEKLLACCQSIEIQQGRIKVRHWGERSIDLDILLYAEQQIETDALVIPHPGICLRDFVYMPLLEVDPEIVVPGKGSLKDIVQSERADHGCHPAGNIE